MTCFSKYIIHFLLTWLTSSFWKRIASTNQHKFEATEVWRRWSGTMGHCLIWRWKFIGKVIKKGEWEFNGETKKSFMVRCLEKPLVLRHHNVMRKETLFFTIPCTKRISPLSNTSGGKREEKERVSLDILTGSCLD